MPFQPLPGSRPGPEDPGLPEPRTETGVSSGRFSEIEHAMLTEVAAWWQNRRVADDSRDPLTSLIGGVDLSGTCRTIGTLPEQAEFSETIVPAPGSGPYGATLLVQALGIPDPPDVGEVYSILAICHFYLVPPDGWHTRYTTIARAPSDTTSTEVRTGTAGSIPSILIVGVSELTIDWTINIIRLEL